MEPIKIFLKDLIDKSVTANKIFKRNLLKEYLQIVVLDFIYSHAKYSQLIFYGGSCLAHCFGLPRLSEDLDFVDAGNKIGIPQLAKDLENYFKKNTDLDLVAKVQKFRIILKFSVLKELGLADKADKSESDLLFLKVEIFKRFNFCKKFKTEIIPLFKFNRSVLIKTFDLPTLMATKIRAIFFRKWEKTDKTGRMLAKVKGRDYFDLMWYLEKNIKPNLDCFEKIKETSELQKKLLGIVEKVDAKSIRFDLESLISDKDFVKRIGADIKKILIRQIKENLS